MAQSLEDRRQQLVQIRAQLAVAQTVLARIRAYGDPALAEKEAITRRLIDALAEEAEVLALQLDEAPARVLH